MTTKYTPLTPSDWQDVLSTYDCFDLDPQPNQEITVTSRFDLEQKIMNCWSVVDDIKSLLAIQDSRPVSEDEQANYLIGLATVYQVKFEELFTCFEKMLEEDHKKTLPM